MGSERLPDSTGRADISAVIEGQRQQLFQASGVLHVCRHACASRYEGFDAERLMLALEVVDDLIGEIAETLEQIQRDAGRALSTS